MLDERVRDQWNQCAAEANAQIGEAHRLAARLVEPAREQDLHGQRAAADVAECVEKVEKIEEAEGRDASEANERNACHQDSCHHDAPWAEAVDDPSGNESE